MRYSLENLFDEFCKYLEGKLKWSEKRQKSKKWTETVFDFFKELNKGEDPSFVEKREHMLIDYIWRRPMPTFSTNDIELAVEHENEKKKIDKLINEEVQHLVDIKAENKIGIFYVSGGDEKEFIKRIQEKIRQQWLKLPTEKYLIILGNPTTSQKKRAILFKGLFFNSNGEPKEEKEKIVLQI